MKSKIEIAARIVEQAELLTSLPIFILPDRAHVVAQHPRIGYKAIQSDVTRMQSIGQDVLNAFNTEFFAEDATLSPLKIIDSGRRGETLMFKVSGIATVEPLKALWDQFLKGPYKSKTSLFFPFVVHSLGASAAKEAADVHTVDFRTNRLVIFGRD